ncbi:MAG: EscU/YscU/HrcU family type III secretion system export apparatus switch protein [Bryobacteraceae bacterium]|nr:EscU/YscU/HrcU family type III secretion system export apparatus switch protein [Bryobacterales bacterium]MEB2361100.1 EscU/YscU/HrcU family type III secretion system export apparatus switch protein [Bryobacterales bacterium]NUM99836.1 EscU/YscU/HrcU family type III secretion system export apparatus switch protein [Bryobacteraceae bacterium]
MADSGQKTEKPTQRQLEKARRDGRFPASRDFVGAIQFLVVIGLLVAYTGSFMERARVLLRRLLSFSFETNATPSELTGLFKNTLLPASMPLLIAGFAIVGVTIMTQLLTTNIGFAPKRLAPDLKRLNPLQKIRDLPRQNLPLLMQAVILLPVFSLAIYGIVRDNIHVYLRLPLLSVEAGVRQVGLSMESVLWKGAGVFLLFGFIDIVRQRRRYQKDLRMSKQDIRDEMKEVEGNPQIKARVRRLQRDLVRRQMMKEVPTATAVVVNPTHYAVAIRYRMDSMTAPVVVAKGKNYLALRIRQLATDHEVPIVENPPLAQALYKTAEVGQEIPAHLYRAVAEILAYIYKLMNGKLPG